MHNTTRMHHTDTTNFATNSKDRPSHVLTRTSNTRKLTHTQPAHTHPSCIPYLQVSPHLTPTHTHPQMHVNSRTRNLHTLIPLQVSPHTRTHTHPQIHVNSPHQPAHSSLMHTLSSGVPTSHTTERETQRTISRDAHVQTCPRVLLRQRRKKLGKFQKWKCGEIGALPIAFTRKSTHPIFQ